MSVRPSLRPVGFLVILAAAFSLISCKSDNSTRSPDLPPPKLKALTFTCTTTGGDNTEPHTIQVSQNQAQGLCTASCVYTVVNEDGEQVDQNVCLDFQCRSRDNAIATVTDVNQQPAQCAIRGVGPGNVNIIATVDGGVGSREFNVQAQQASSVALNCGPQPETIPGGATRQYQATATFPDNSTQNVTTQALWTVTPDNANPDFVDVNQAGLVTTRNVAANSAAMVTATFQGQSGSCNFTVVPAQITRVCVEPETGVDFFFGTTRPVTNGGNCVSPEVTLQLASTTGANTRRYRARVVFNSNQETDATLQAVWTEVPAANPVICVEHDADDDGNADAGDSDCAATGLTDGRVVATAVGGPVQVRADFGGANGTAALRVDAGGGNQVLARNSLLVGNPVDSNGNGIRGEPADIPSKFFCVGYADLVGGLTRVPELPGNKQMIAVIRTCTADASGNLPAGGNCVPCNVALDAAGNCPTPGGLSAPRATAAEINAVQWAVPQDRSFFDGNDCAATQTQATTGNIPAARVGNVATFPSATDPTDPTLKGNVTAIGAVRLGTACVRGTLTSGLPPNNFDSDGATAIVLPVTNDVLLENANDDAVQLCNTLVPLFELGLQNGPGAVTQLVSVLSDILNPLLTAITQDQTGGGPIPTDDLIDQLTAGLGALTNPLLQALEDLVQTVDSDVYAPVSCGLGSLLQALLGNPEQVEAVQECAP